MATASYSGYNFITEAESLTASEIAVHGKTTGGGCTHRRYRYKDRIDEVDREECAGANDKNG
jgi:hypothetical protein